MKKFAYSFFVVSTLLFFISCSESTNTDDADWSEPFNALESELNEYNDKFFSDIDTRSGFFRKLGRIVSADALGALLGYGAMGPVGGFGGAVISSLGCMIADMCESEASSMEYDDFFDSSAVIFEDDLSNDVIYIGNAHNELISQILEDNIGLEDLSNSELVELIEYSAEEYGYDFPSIPTSTLDYILSLSDRSTSDEMFSMVEIDFPSLQDQIHIVEIYSQNLPNVEKDLIADYSLGFINVIENSKIDNNSKNMIEASVSVAGNSSVLWDQCSVE